MPEDKEEDVKNVDEANSSQPDQTKDVNEDAENSSIQQDQEQTQDESVQNQDAPSAFDETNVPWRNRYAESERKYKDLVEKIPEIIREEMKTATQSQKNNDDYSIEELEAFMDQETTSPEHRRWARQKIREKEQALLVEKIRNETIAEKKARESEERKNKSLTETAKLFPNLFTKNAQGQIVGWDTTNPMVYKIDKLMEDPRLKNDPDGILLAAKLAFADHSLSGQNQAINKSKELAKKVKKLQAQSISEGAGKNSPEDYRSDVRKNIDRLKQARTSKDQKAALRDSIKSYFKATGVIRGD